MNPFNASNDSVKCSSISFLPLREVLVFAPYTPTSLCSRFQKGQAFDVCLPEYYACMTDTKQYRGFLCHTGQKN